MSSAVAHQTEHEATYVELPNAGTQQGERNDRTHVDRHAGKNDSPRTVAVDQTSEQWRDQAQSDGGDGEAARDGFPIPSELGGERLHENGECVNEQRAESGHHAKTRSQNHAPAVVSEIEFRRVDGGARYSGVSDVAWK